MVEWRAPRVERLYLHDASRETRTARSPEESGQAPVPTSGSRSSPLRRQRFRAGQGVCAAV